MDNNNFELIENLIKRPLSKTEQEKFQVFEQLFGIYNAHTNLVSKNDEKLLFEKHIYDSLSMVLFLEKYGIKEEAKILDVGTGGGFPSLPLSILYPELQIYPLDSIAKKIGFIELVQKELRLENLHPLCSRVEDLKVEYKENFDVVTSRAVAALNILLEYTMPFVKTDGYFVAFKSKNADEEIAGAKNALDILNGQILERIAYNLPVEEACDRELLVIKKTKSCAIKYPRRSGLPRKNPL